MRRRIVAVGQATCNRQFGIEVEAGLELQRLQPALIGGAELGEGVAQRIAGRRAQTTVGGGVHQPVDLEQHVNVVP